MIFRPMLQAINLSAAWTLITTSTIGLGGILTKLRWRQKLIAG